MKKYLFILFFFLSIPFVHAEDEEVLKTAWTAFSCKHPSLKSLSPQEIAKIANQWGEHIAKTLFVSEPIREIDPLIIEKLLLLLQEDQPKVFMRHGEQQKTEQVKKLTAAEQKIAMMQLPDNLDNGLTKVSLAEWMEGMIIWEYLKQKTGKSFVVESSKNKRAKLPASTLAYALKAPLSFNESLSCINYPSQMPTSEILKLVPDGTLPWEKQKVDALIGPGTYEQINQEMEKLLTTCLEVNTIFIALTHTQQINAVALLLDKPLLRLGNFGFILSTDQNKEMFAEGFFQKKSN